MTAPLTWEIPAALLGHAVVFAIVFGVAALQGPSEPLFELEDALVVEMAGPMKMTTRMPQKAERAPDPARGTPEPTLTPPPKNPSDLAFQTPDAPTKQGDNSAAREELLRQMAREAALRDLTAPLGQTDRAATSPDATSTEAGTGTGALGDPELRAWVEKARRAVEENTASMRLYCRGKDRLTAVVEVRLDSAGRLDGDARVGRPSGDAAVDNAAVRAVQMTGQLPPLPEKYRGRAVMIDFACKEFL